jgi:hypothetical protein
MEANVFEWLQSWYLSHANGDWEHQHGITLETLDNPGWHVSIDLEETELEKKEFVSLRIETNEQDWITCRVENKKFEGFCGPNNLQKVLNAFREWAAVE